MSAAAQTTATRRAKEAALLWIAGFREACCLHRVVFFCFSSRTLLIRTGQCFLLNGLIFLGSLFTVKSVVIPIILRILPDRCEQLEQLHLCDHKAIMTFYSFLRSILIEIFYILWFYPLYIFSFILSTLWYNDIAKHAFDVLKSNGLPTPRELDNNNELDSQERPGGLDGVILGIGEQIYSILLLTVFFIEVFVTGFIPYFGKAINFLLLTWMYAYYCFEYESTFLINQLVFVPSNASHSYQVSGIIYFDFSFYCRYKWNFLGVSLNKRLDFFESNWAFFSGFGSPCVLPTFFFSPLVSYGVMAILYPLFVLTAAGTEAEDVIDSRRKSWGGEPEKLQIFYVARRFSTLVLQLFPGAQKEQ